MDITSFLLSFLLIITYQLALAHFGVSIKIRDTIVPSMILSIIAYVSKIVFHAPPIPHTLVIVISCAVLLYVFNKINPLLSIIGSLLSMITFIIGSLLIACPFMIKIGFEIPHDTTGIQWVLLNLLEFFVPAVVLLVLKTKKYFKMKLSGI